MPEALDEAIFAALPRSHDNAEIAQFYRLIRAYPARGGKRLRGQFLLRSVAAHGGDWREGVKVAAALELFQNWVLIHDDIEDGSESRRGEPALHHLAGMPVALNVGDALHAYMWQLLYSTDHLPDASWRAVLAEFAWMIQRTAEGQHLDLSWVAQGRFDVSEDEYLAMVTLKTAYYTVVCPLRLGAYCAGEKVHGLLSQGGADVGVAFQIRDDVLNLMPEVAYGKEFAGDLYEGKRTLILAHFFSQAQAAERDEATAILTKARCDKTEGEIGRLLFLIRRHGSLGYAQALAEARAARGLERLQEAFEPLPEALALIGLLESLASRRH